MDRTLFLLYLLPLIGDAEAVYKQWIPNTNFENASNWNEHRIPCSQDKVIFEKNKRVSVYVQSTHPLSDMYMPWDGEFFLAPSAGFSASSRDDPACEAGPSVTFHDTDHYQWFDPTLWNSALSMDDLEISKHLFSVDAERVPCQYDDVIFLPETSFRVNFKTAPSEMNLRSISVMGRRFIRNEEFTQYLHTVTGKLQFPGPARIKITNSKCPDKTGCDCGNDGMIQEICSALLQHTENRCPEMPCANALKPLGHCCEICGATISLEYTSDFDMEIYRNRLIHTFLSLSKYSGVKLAISKAQRPHSILGIFPRESVPEIQIVITDDKMGAQTGSDAEQLAYDIMSDIDNHGRSFGIVKGTLQTAGGNTSSAQGGHMAASSIVGVVFGIILCVSLLGVIFFLYRTGIISLPSSRLFMFWRRTDRPDSAVENKGFENPIYGTTIERTADAPGLYSGDEALQGIITQGGIQFINPLYDESQCEILREATLCDAS